MIRTALIQRICTHYRAAPFRTLAEQKDIDLTVYFGRGQKNGSLKNAAVLPDFRHVQLFTIGCTLRFGDRLYYVVFHPTLLLHLIREKYDVLLCEGASNLLNDVLLVLYSMVSGVPFVWWDSGRNPAHPRRLLRRLADPLLAFMAKRAQACIAYGTMARDYLISIGVEPERIYVAQNAIDTRHVGQELAGFNEEAIESKRRELGIAGKRIALYVGALEKRKKVNELLAAFKMLKARADDTVLLIVGDGSHRSELERDVRNSGMRDVHFLGGIVDEVGLYFMLSDIFVLPSEGGLAINQALAYGLPVLFSSADGTETDLTRTAGIGLSFEKGNISDMAEKMYSLLVRHPVSRTCCQEAGRRVREEFTIERMTRSMAQAIEHAHRERRKR